MKMQIIILLSILLISGCDKPADYCSNGFKDSNGETGIDCGGSCQPCSAFCSNGIKDGDETGIDCGGSCQQCLPTTCSNGIQDPDELGIDCGGRCLQCLQDWTHRNLNDTIWFIHSDAVSIDIDADGVDDITFQTSGSVSHFYNRGDSHISRNNNGIEFLVDSFDYYYCRDTTIYGNDTLFVYGNCVGTDNFLSHITPVYSVVQSDSVLPSGVGFYAPQANLYKWNNSFPPYTAGNNSKQYIEEGLFREYPPPAFIYLRWNKNGEVNYYSIQTEWDGSPPVFYIKGIYKFRG